jgi:hypothetical protein
MTLLIAIVAAWTGAIPQIVPADVKWEQNYVQARELAARLQKPLAVFVGSGAEGWKQVVREGNLNAAARRELHERFVPVYVNAETEAGQNLAGAFELANKRGLIISDRTGGLMAFHQDGDLELADLVKHLNRLGDPDHVVSVTETNDPSAPPYVPHAQVALAPAAPAGGYVNPFACQT